MPKICKHQKIPHIKMGYFDINIVLNRGWVDLNIIFCCNNCKTAFFSRLKNSSSSIQEMSDKIEKVTDETAILKRYG